MKKELKGQIIESISAQLQQYPDFYITDIAGLNAGQTSKLRRECFNEGVVLTVVKNTLFAHVLKGIDNADLQTLLDTLVGNTAIMYTTAPAAPARIIKKLQREGFTKPVVKGAYVQECVFVGEDKLDQLAAIKTKNELIGDIIGLLQSPIRNIVSALENASEGKGEDEKIGAALPVEAPAAEVEEAPVVEETPAAAEAPVEEAAPAAEEAQAA